MPVVDASVVVDWIRPGAEADGLPLEVLRRLLATRARLSAPRLLSVEVGNALLSGVRRRRWSGAEADESFALLSGVPIHHSDTAADLDAAWHLSRRYDEHPLHDMVYVALAQRLGEPLITADDRLLRRLIGHPTPVLTPEMFLS